MYIFNNMIGGDCPQVFILNFNPILDRYFPLKSDRTAQQFNFIIYSKLNIIPFILVINHIKLLKITDSLKATMQTI